MQTFRAGLALTITLCVASASLAQGGGAKDNTPSASLPVKAVTLFSSGVSFTLREGEVDGNATVPLSFRTVQINDILKSLVLLDEKGRVQPAIYGARDPIGRTLQSFVIDLNRPPSRGELLMQLTGQKVEVEAGGQPYMQFGQPAQMLLTPVRKLVGQIVGVEQGGSPGTLLLLTEAGLQSVGINEIQAVKFLDERVNREFREALSLLASGADDKRRQVVLRFDGSGKRRVRVGYVTESPLWKVSYRLLLGGSGISGLAPVNTNGKPYLQGWALVENTTDEDWVDVRLALVSGRPVSFLMDLYQPLYLPRPVVAPDVVASPYPQIAEGAIENGRDMNAPAPVAMGVPMAAKPLAMRRGSGAPSPASPGGFGGGMGGGGFGGGGFGGPGGGVTGMADRFGDSAANGSLSLDASNAAILRASVSAQAQGEKSGELFAYQINTPVSLPRQQAAMIPVIAQEIDGVKVSLYNADSDRKHPMNGVRVKNNTKLHLKSGPVTLFDGGNYAGDARLDDIPPGDSRIVTYAVDLAVDGERQDRGASAIETGILIRRGVLIVSRKETVETVYTLKNKADEARLVLVEHPFQSEFKLVAPAKFDERTPSVYRFPVTIAAGKSETLVVKTERPLSETYALIDSDLSQLEYQVGRKSGVPENVKAALANVLTRRRKIDQLNAQVASKEAQVKSIDSDQGRIRSNMSALDRNSSLYLRYVKELTDQEDRIQALRAEIVKLRTSADSERESLNGYLDTLTLGG